MVGSELGETKWKHESILPCLSGSDRWYNGGGQGHPFMTTVDHLLMARSSRIMHKITRLKSSVSGTWQVQSLDLNPVDHLWNVVELENYIVDVQPTNLQELCHALVSVWNVISEEFFQHLVESTPGRSEAAAKAKGVQQFTNSVWIKKSGWWVYMHTSCTWGNFLTSLYRVSLRMYSFPPSILFGGEGALYACFALFWKSWESTHAAPHFCA